MKKLIKKNVNSCVLWNVGSATNIVPSIGDGFSSGVEFSTSVALSIDVES